jgi:hypothetical protein
MTPRLSAPLADAVLLVHIAVIAFNIFGLVAVPLGAWRGWTFVRVAWWRVLHLALLFAVAAQAVLGRACFLTLWQAALEGGGQGTPPPLIYAWIEGLIFWDLPIWVFAALYVAVLIYALALMWLVPPRRRHS